MYFSKSTGAIDLKALKIVIQHVSFFPIKISDQKHDK